MMHQLDCILILLAYASFTSLIMVSMCEGCCGEPTTLCSRLEVGGSCGRSRVSYKFAGIACSFFFLKICLQNTIIITTITTRTDTMRRNPIGNPTESPMFGEGERSVTGYNTGKGGI